MYYLTIEDKFSSAHQLKGYKGKCEQLHGHNWKVEITVKGANLAANGLLIDFHDLKRILGDILAPLDHTNLNQVEPFSSVNPSSENIARHIYDQFNAALGHAAAEGIVVDSVSVWESDTSRCTYRP